MRSVVRSFRVWLKLLLLSTCTVLLVTLRYILKTPQPLESVLPGESRVYKWVYGHIFYKSMGASEAPPLVLIHAPGVGASSYEMCSLMERLAQHYHVYALDLLGFGLSDHPSMQYSAQTYIQLCHDFLSEVVGRPATLLASGLSYQYCCAVATEHPNLCERCIFFVPPVVFAEHRLPSWLGRFLRESALCTVLYAIVTRRPFLHSLLAWQSGREYNSISDAMLDHYYASAHQRGAQYAAIAFLTGDLAAKAYALQTVSLSQPTLIIVPFQTLSGKHIGSCSLYKEKVYTSNSNKSSLNVLEGLHTRWPRVQILQLQNFAEQGELAVQRIIAWRDSLEARVPVAVVAQESIGHEATEVPVAAPLAVVAQESIEHEATEAPVAAPPPFVPHDIGNGSTTEETEQTERIVAEADEPLVSQPPVDEQSVTNRVLEAGQQTTDTIRTVEAYCVKCRKKRKMQRPRKIVTKKGRSAIEGECPICGTRLFRFVAGQA